MWIRSTGTFGYVILSEDHCAFLELQGAPSLWEPDCMEICILYIIKDLLVLKSGAVMFSLKQRASCTQKCLRCHLFLFQEKFALKHIYDLLCLMVPPRRPTWEHERAWVVILSMITDYRIFLIFFMVQTVATEKGARLVAVATLSTVWKLTFSFIITDHKTAGLFFTAQIFVPTLFFFHFLWWRPIPIFTV